MSSILQNNFIGVLTEASPPQFAQQIGSTWQPQRYRNGNLALSILFSQLLAVSYLSQT